MWWLFVALVVPQFSYVSCQDALSNIPNSLRNRWYGPSYQPSWWDPDSFVGFRASDFTYDGLDAPNTWPDKFSECAGQEQSPINIQTRNLQRRKTRKPLKWINYSKTPRSMVVENSGHSVHLNGVWRNSSDTPYITNGVLKERYFFSQLHFHWGKDSSRGSEHTVNKLRYPLEMHVVHDRNFGIPSNTSENDRSDELVVIGFMFEVVEEDNLSLNPILEGTRKIQGSSRRKTNIKPFPISDIVDVFGGDYVTYRGSLTTPPCTEGVIWIMASQAIGISESQLNVLRKTVTGRQGRRIQNFRPVQPLNGRRLYYIYC